MDYGYCFLAVVPVRKEPTSLSEQVTQLIFGDFVEILGTKDSIITSNNWTKVRILEDGYKGWIDSRCIFKVEKDDVKDNKYLVKDFVAPIAVDSTVIPVPFGAKILDGEYTLAAHKFHALNGKSLTSPLPFNSGNLNMVMINYLNCPYQWGGKSTLGIDCSGFTQIVYSFFGIKLFRDAKDQAKQGKDIAFEDIKEGDLMFFGEDLEHISHVGIALKDSHVLHCSAYVHADQYTKEGIFDTFIKGAYSHHFLKAVRLI